VSTSFETTKFLTLARDERLLSEYFVRRSDRRIFNGAMLAGIVTAAFVGLVIYGVFLQAEQEEKQLQEVMRERDERKRREINEEYQWRVQETQDDDYRRYLREQRDHELKELERDSARRRTPETPEGIPLAAGIAPPVLAFLFFLLRHRHNAFGYLALTNRRVLYYEYDAHPRQNYRYLAEARIQDITGIHLATGRSFLRRHMWIVVTTKRYAPIYVAASGGLGFAAELLRTDASPSACIPADDAIQCVQELGGRIRAAQAGASVTLPTASMPVAPAPSRATSVKRTCGTCGMDVKVSTASTAGFTCPHCGSTT
jgi:hypothetical protein